MTAPKPASSSNRPLRGGSVAKGISFAIAGHGVALAISAGLITLIGRSTELVGAALTAALITEGAFLLICVAVGVVQLVRGDRGLGLGLILGWLIGMAALIGVSFAIA